MTNVKSNVRSTPDPLSDDWDFPDSDDLDAPAGVSGRIVDGQKLRAFILAGNAKVTVRSQRTQARFTFKVRKNKNTKFRASHWVSVLTGPDNENSYTSLGSMYERVAGVMFYHSDRSAISKDAPSAVAMAWIWKYAIAKGLMPPGIEVWHEGRCGRCGRPLTVPESIESGFGPECINKVFGCE